MEVGGCLREVRENWEKQEHEAECLDYGRSRELVLRHRQGQKLNSKDSEAENLELSWGKRKDRMKGIGRFLNMRTEVLQLCL